MTESFDGYYQLIDKETGKVLQQRRAKNTPQMLLHFATKVWRMTGDVDIVFTPKSDYVQPCKFFGVLEKCATINVFDDCCDGSVPDKEASWTGTAEEYYKRTLTSGGMFASWSAFTVTGEWVGTSEY